MVAGLLEYIYTQINERLIGLVANTRTCSKLYVVYSTRIKTIKVSCRIRRCITSLEKLTFQVSMLDLNSQDTVR